MIGQGRWVAAVIAMLSAGALTLLPGSPALAASTITCNPGSAPQISGSTTSTGTHTENAYFTCNVDPASNGVTGMSEVLRAEYLGTAYGCNPAPITSHTPNFNSPRPGTQPATLIATRRIGRASTSPSTAPLASVRLAAVDARALRRCNACGMAQTSASHRRFNHRRESAADAGSDWLHHLFGVVRVLVCLPVQREHVVPQQQSAYSSLERHPDPFAQQARQAHGGNGPARAYGPRRRCHTRIARCAPAAEPRRANDRSVRACAAHSEC
jgi:hypothetical protein